MAHVDGLDDGVGYGVRGESLLDNRGVVGMSRGGQAIYGHSTTQVGVAGESEGLHGVYGTSHDVHNAGVFGNNLSGAGFGVVGDVTIPDTHQGHGVGVAGFSDTWQGVYGHSITNAGVVGEAEKFHGVYGVSHDPNNAALFGVNDGNGYGVIARGRVAGHFDGDMEVTGDIRLTNADCAEEFDIAQTESVDPGTVMVLTGGGGLCPSQQAYDKRVAGIVSGAGDYRPALILDRQTERGNRQPIALMGKVFCKVDAQYGPVEIGDLLTTSPTPGHAMKAADPLKAFGSVIGKALRPLEDGQELIPVLVSLQ
jgi:hypothetical protein